MTLEEKSVSFSDETTTPELDQLMHSPQRAGYHHLLNIFRPISSPKACYSDFSLCVVLFANFPETLDSSHTFELLFSLFVR